MLFRTLLRTSVHQIINFYLILDLLHLNFKTSISFRSVISHLLKVIWNFWLLSTDKYALGLNCNCGIHHLLSKFESLSFFLSNCYWSGIQNLFCHISFYKELLRFFFSLIYMFCSFAFWGRANIQFFIFYCLNFMKLSLLF